MSQQEIKKSESAKSRLIIDLFPSQYILSSDHLHIWRISSTGAVSAKPPRRDDSLVECNCACK